MIKEIIRSDKVTPPRAPLSPAVRSNGFVFVSGQPGFFDDRQIAENDFDAQMHQVMANVKACWKKQAPAWTISSKPM